MSRRRRASNDGQVLAVRFQRGHALIFYLRDGKSHTLKTTRADGRLALAAKNILLIQDHE